MILYIEKSYNRRINKNHKSIKIIIMKKIMFNDKYNLTTAVLNGSKTQTRRIVSEKLLARFGHNKYNDKSDELIFNAPFKIGEIVAIAQSYYDIKTSVNSYRPKIWKGYDAWHKYLDTLPIGNAGHYNKMFVRAELMPNKIKITDIRIQRLQDISDNDCIAEGIIKYANGVYTYAIDRKKIFRSRFGTPRVVYADLIDRINGKGTWNSNSYVFVYDFKLVNK